MQGTTLTRLLSALASDQVLYSMTVPGVAVVFTVRDGVIYQHRATDTGHGYMLPQVSDRAAWARIAQVCAFTVPANPETMQLGAAGARLGAFWRSLPSAAAERRVEVAQLRAVVQP